MNAMTHGLLDAADAPKPPSPALLADDGISESHLRAADDYQQALSEFAVEHVMEERFDEVSEAVACDATFADALHELATTGNAKPLAALTDAAIKAEAERVLL